MKIEVELVRKMIAAQFPEFAHLPIQAVKNGGHDNRTFHLGDELLIRMPSGKAYEAQVEKESEWLPKLAPQLSLPITEPVAKGKPTKDYPYSWSINKWIVGETVTQNNVDLNQFAGDLAGFLKELQTIDASVGPRSGVHNFYRGGDLKVYDTETRNALYSLKDQVDVETCQRIWEQALSSKWQGKRVWVHGDIAPGNLIVRNGRLAGVIDFGILGTGDPSCDLAMAWTFFDANSRAIFMEKMVLDEDTWNRARGWALWKALITFDHEASRKVVKCLVDGH